MESKIVDARGMGCPIPVINTKKVLEAIDEGSVTTFVDNEAAKDNVIALANSMGCGVDIQHKGNEYHIQITKKGTNINLGEQPADTDNTTIVISSSEMGRGSSELGDILMKSFMFTLVESEKTPQTILFVNGGVYLTCENSPVLDHLVSLQSRGVEILSCGTCLEHFKLKEKLAIGQITNMYTIYEKMNAADKVVSL
ncbi:sulfurtransferase-like selenium metabolism protein YedF [Phosphitispora sp. TUW77]|uniref:sulfurtransferase-like selenium metabolism protein YedF n=1 Tax=Phosphitispora sp. TUW77 TaxID=3152361 RepID=UPI003AB517C8